MLGIPLIAGDQKLGAIGVGFKELHRFTQDDVDQGQEIAGQVALAITKLRLYAEIQRLAIVDELTGLYNRRGIFELGRQQVELAHRTGIPLSMVWLDIDQFKSINDRFGHHIGDEIISVLADRCRNNLKKRDLVGRYGGEGGDELIILLPDTNLEAAMEIAERLRVVIMKSSIATHEGKIDVTVSQGVTTLRSNHEDFSELLNRADKTMYAAKAAGRNCVLMQA
jgi:diguanylate cyclase (GGDEF)-like protein